MESISVKLTTLQFFFIWNKGTQTTDIAMENKPVIGTLSFIGTLLLDSRKR